jgi:hypothetical protein
MLDSLCRESSRCPIAHHSIPNKCTMHRSGHAFILSLPLAPFELPFADMCTTIHVQHLPGHLARLSQIEHGVGDILSIEDTSKR